MPPVISGRVSKSECSLKQQVIETCPWLIGELAFRVVDDEYRPESFGDSFVTLESPVLRIRFLRDRGQIFVELASPTAPEKWRDLTFVLRAIQGKVPQESFALDEVANRLRNHFAELVEAMGPKLEETERKIEKIFCQRRSGPW